MASLAVTIEPVFRFQAHGPVSEALCFKQTWRNEMNLIWTDALAAIEKQKEAYFCSLMAMHHRDDPKIMETWL